MDRYFFVSEDLDELEAVEIELEKSGVTTSQIHVLSDNDRDVALHRRLHEVHSFMKTDVVRSGLIGACFGVVAAALVIGVTYFAGPPTTWTPFVFLAIVLLGFCTWEGGFLGFQIPNRRFSRFQDLLRAGKHVLFVDVNPEQVPQMEQVLAGHRKLQPAGTGDASPWWVISWHHNYRKFQEWAP